MTPEQIAKMQAGREEANARKKAIRDARPKLEKTGMHKTSLDYRNSKEPPLLSLRDAIQVKCMDCCCDQFVEVRECPAQCCPLWPFRLGGEQEINQKYWEENKL